MTGVRAPSCAAVLREDLRWPFRSLESPPSRLFEYRAGWSRNRLNSRRSRILVSVFFCLCFLGFGFLGVWVFGVSVSVSVWSWWFWFCMVLWSPFPGAVFGFLLSVGFLVLLI